MRTIRYPSYYKEFKCIASKCTDSCCEGWEIDIDSDSLAFYKSVEGEFGKRLKESICWEEIEDTPHFLTNENARCPFLNNENLCDLFINLGEEHLCQICTDHPRFYEWLTDITEGGVGLCCEEAVRIILAQKGAPNFYTLEDEAFTDDSDVLELESLSAQELRQDSELENLLFSMRERCFALINKEDDSLLTKFNDLFLLADSLQEELDDLLYPIIEDEDYEEEAKEKISSDSSFNDFFWNERNLSIILDTYLDLEINDEKWKERLSELKGVLNKLISSRDAFLKYYEAHGEEYIQLLNYYLYRYFLKARLDEAVDEKIHFSLLSVSMICLLDIHTWIMEKELTNWQQIENVKMYSKEIEYNEANVEDLSSLIKNIF